MRRRVGDLLKGQQRIRISAPLFLQMTKEGWLGAKQYFPRERGVYIHFAEYLGTSVVLRIGISAQAAGIQGRWFHNQASHFQSFRHQWDQNSAHGGENYCEFFTQSTQIFPNTWILFLTAVDFEQRELLLLEQYLIGQLRPCWEREENELYIWKDGFRNDEPPSLQLVIENSLHQ